MKYQNENDFAKANMFGKGEPNVIFAQYFIGESFLNPQTDFQNGEFPDRFPFLFPLRERVPEAQKAYGSSDPEDHRADDPPGRPRVPERRLRADPVHRVAAGDGLQDPLRRRPEPGAHTVGQLSSAELIIAVGSVLPQIRARFEPFQDIRVAGRLFPYAVRQT